MDDLMTTETTDNGVKSSSDGRKARVKFGPADHQSVPHEWAQRMLTRLFETNRSQFGKMLQYAAGVDSDAKP